MPGSNSWTYTCAYTSAYNSAYASEMHSRSHAFEIHSRSDQILFSFLYQAATYCHVDSLWKALVFWAACHPQFTYHTRCWSKLCRCWYHETNEVIQDNKITHLVALRLHFSMQAVAYVCMHIHIYVKLLGYIWLIMANACAHAGIILCGQAPTTEPTPAPTRAPTQAPTPVSSTAIMTFCLRDNRVNWTPFLVCNSLNGCVSTKHYVLCYFLCSTRFSWHFMNLLPGSDSRTNTCTYTSELLYSCILMNQTTAPPKICAASCLLCLTSMLWLALPQLPRH